MDKATAKKWLKQAEKAALASDCLSRHVGAVLIAGGQIVGQGCNRTPAGTTSCGTGGCERCSLVAAGRLKHGQQRELCRCLHAEAVAIQAAQAACQLTIGAVVVGTAPPCIPCAHTMAAAGIVLAVYPHKSQEGPGVLELARLGVGNLALDA